MKVKTTLGGAMLMLASLAATAAQPADFLARFEREARQADGAFAASPARGEAWFQARHGREWSCSTCHTPDPAGRGKHAVTGKPIEPMAPVANPERLTSDRSVDKWFRRNCRDVVGRECTPAEKADVIAYLMRVGS